MGVTVHGFRGSGFRGCGFTSNPPAIPARHKSGGPARSTAGGRRAGVNPACHPAGRSNTCWPASKVNERKVTLNGEL